MSAPTSTELPQAHLRPGTVGGWRSYLVVAVEWTLLFFAFRRVSFPNDAVLVALGVCAALASWPVYQFFLDTEIILYLDRLVVRRMGHFRPLHSVPLSEILKVWIGSSHSQALQIELRDGIVITVGPWGHFSQKRLALLEALVATLREKTGSTDRLDPHDPHA
jgi:hypothetical protein